MLVKFGNSLYFWGVVVLIVVFVVVWCVGSGGWGGDVGIV